MTQLLLFSASDGTNGREIYITDADGTTATRIDINPGGGDAITNDPQFINDPTFVGDSASIGGSLFFAADDGTDGTELYLIDGTLLGSGVDPATAVKQVRDINTGGASNPADFVSVGNLVFFTADDGTSGRELWKSDGTEGGTERVTDLVGGSGSSDPTNLVEFDGAVLFSASVGGTTVIYRSDGTPGGTEALLSFPGTDATALLDRGAELNGRLFFQVEDGPQGSELYVTDGTVAGTTLLKNINPGAADSSPASFQVLGDSVIFSADNGEDGTELWISDGTPEGTELLADINPGPAGGNPGFADFTPDRFTSLGDVLVFQARDETEGTELFRTDGTTGGTQLVENVAPGNSNFFPSKLTLVGDGTRAVFGGNDRTNGRELWVTDGTELGTFLVRDITPGPGNGFPDFFIRVGGLVYFKAEDGPDGAELWVTNGTNQGTSQVADINGGGGDSNPRPIGVINLNEAPQAPFLDGGAVGDNAPLGTVVGTVSASDPDFDPLTFTLIDDAGGLFRLVGTELQVAAPLGSAGPTETVTVRVADPDGETAQANLTITISDLNLAPTDIELSGDSVGENAPVGTVVGVVSGSDPDGDPLTFSLIGNAGGAFSLVGNEVQVAGPLDFASGPTETITLQARDPGNLSFQEDFTISVQQGNLPPSDLTLTRQTVAENSARGTVVGRLEASDPNGDALTFILTDNAGGKFSVVGNQLRVAGPLDFETSTSETVTVRAEDGDGSGTTQRFEIAITDVVDATAGSDSLRGDANANTIDALAGDDTLFGLGGADRLYGGAGADRVDGGTEDDFLFGKEDDDILIGRFGADRLVGAEGDDDLRGGDDNDRLFGGSENDAIRGNSGDDIANGGSGVDVMFGGSGDDTLVGAAGEDRIFGDAGNDLIRGASGSDRLFGRSGSDRILGEGGNDRINGEGGNDTLFGGNANDIINGGGGNDLLRGDDGVDRYVFEAPFGQDRIVDFDAAAGEKIDFRGNDDVQSFADLTISQRGANTLIVTDAGRITLLNTQAETIGADAFLTDMPAPPPPSGVPEPTLTLRRPEVVEDARVNTVVGTVSTGEGSDGFRFRLTDDADGKFRLDAANQLRVADALDFETASAERITILVIDDNGGRESEVFTIAIGDVDEGGGGGNGPPTGLRLSNSSVLENRAAGTEIGRVLANDPDGDQLDFILTDDAGGAFVLQGNRLLANRSFDFEASPSERVTIAADDGINAPVERNFVINIIDLNENGEDTPGRGGRDNDFAILWDLWA
ncbi:MAG: ELWxxDGT repeat protein [Pseudomonadota bacterium]